MDTVHPARVFDRIGTPEPLSHKSPTADQEEISRIVVRSILCSLIVVCPTKNLLAQDMVPPGNELFIGITAGLGMATKMSDVESLLGNAGHDDTSLLSEYPQSSASGGAVTVTLRFQAGKETFVDASYAYAGFGVSHGWSGTACIFCADDGRSRDISKQASSFMLRVGLGGPIGRRERYAWIAFGPTLSLVRLSVNYDGRSSTMLNRKRIGLAGALGSRIPLNKAVRLVAEVDYLRLGSTAVGRVDVSFDHLLFLFGLQVALRPFGEPTSA